MGMSRQDARESQRFFLAKGARSPAAHRHSLGTQGGQLSVGLYIGISTKFGAFWFQEL